eukprot:388195-Prymnesium_polylepis.1
MLWAQGGAITGSRAGGACGAKAAPSLRGGVGAARDAAAHRSLHERERHALAERAAGQRVGSRIDDGVHQPAVNAGLVEDV